MTTDKKPNKNLKGGNEKMNAGKITAKMRYAVPICFMVDGKKVKHYKNIELPDELKKLEIKDFKFHVLTDSK